MNKTIVFVLAIGLLSRCTIFSTPPATAVPFEVVKEDSQLLQARIQNHLPHWNTECNQYWSEKHWFLPPLPVAGHVLPVFRHLDTGEFEESAYFAGKLQNMRATPLDEEFFVVLYTHTRDANREYTLLFCVINWSGEGGEVVGADFRSVIGTEDRGGRVENAAWDLLQRQKTTTEWFRMLAFCTEVSPTKAPITLPSH